jgi:hypothetical protein
MRAVAEIETRLEQLAEKPSVDSTPDELLMLGEEILEHWVTARGEEPTRASREGFRLLALQRQGSNKEPSFNACRETCRELIYHYNLIRQHADHAQTQQRLNMMVLVANHLFLFVSGKMEVQGLGDFCCSARPVRMDADELTLTREN